MIAGGDSTTACRHSGHVESISTAFNLWCPWCGCFYPSVSYNIGTFDACSSEPPLGCFRRRPAHLNRCPEWLRGNASTRRARSPRPYRARSRRAVRRSAKHRCGQNARPPPVAAPIRPDKRHRRLHPVPKWHTGGCRFSREPVDRVLRSGFQPRDIKIEMQEDRP